MAVRFFHGATDRETAGVTLLGLVGGGRQISASGGNDEPAVEKLHSWFRSTAVFQTRRWPWYTPNPRYVSDATKFGVTAPNLFEVVRKGAESVRKSPGAGPTSEKRRNGRPSAPAPEERRIGDGTRRPATRNRAVRAVAYPVTDTGKSAEKTRSSRAPQPPVWSDAKR